ncbi:MAG: hypothetical protein JSV25_14045 [Spirochaetota bacterium]|nr:MAG: hypothetical protein JSV25_14045 [Spirochaetota bacterium]
MKRVFFIAFIIFYISFTCALAEIEEIIKRADRLYEVERHDDSVDYLLQSMDRVKLKRDRAELYWRLARATLNIGDRREKEGASTDELLEIFEKGQQYAEQAIEHDPKNHFGHYWKSANIGRWGQTKGILDSLFKAGPMRDLLKRAVELNPDHSQSYNVLGQLYEQVPGFPLSFGNVDFSVSLGRKACDLLAIQHRMGLEKELDYDFYTELAKHLYARNWVSSKREREQERKYARYKSISHPFEKNLYYEGSIELEDISDREEALKLIKWVIAELEKISPRKVSQNDDLKEAKETLAGW